MNQQNRPIAIDLFAGAGGMTLGFEQAGFDVLATVELDPIHCATHEFNFPHWPILCKSVSDTSAKEIREKSSIGNKEIDVVVGGPPCQGFSLMGKRAFDDPRNSLVFHFLRLVLELQPKYFVMENVKGLTIGKHQQLIGEIIEISANNGYRVEENYQVLNAANYGVPQNRERLFLLGCKKDLPLPTYPQPIVKPAKLKSKKNNYSANLLSGPTVKDAIGDLPIIENYPDLLKQDWLIGEYGEPSHYSGQLRGIYPMVNNYGYQRADQEKVPLGKYYITGCMATQHTAPSIQRFANTKPGETEAISRFYRLDPAGLCNTLRAGTASDRGAHTSPRPIHPFHPRCITVREAARLHSYPDWFRFHTTKWHGFRQIGNSVPPLLAQAVATEIIRSLGKNPVKPIGIQKLGITRLLEMNPSQAVSYYGLDSQAIEPRKRMKKSGVESD